MSADHHHQRGRYEIRLGGRLESRWGVWFDGKTLTHVHHGNAVLTGPVVDQAALHGLLDRLRHVGLPLISVTQAQPDQPAEPRSTLAS
jgi:hypothetical protein